MISSTIGAHGSRFVILHSYKKIKGWGYGRKKKIVN
jgi:hypothetical protein